MKCPNCGKEIANGSRFCGFCGYGLSEEEIEQGSSSSGKNVLGKIKSTLKNTDKKILGIGALVICLVIGLIVFFTTRKPTIDLQDYFTVETTGADGYGKATVAFDEDQLYADILDACDLTDIAEEYDDYFYNGQENVLSSDDYSKFMNFIDVWYSISYEVDVTSGLSNGDTVTVTFNFDNDLAEELGFKFKGDALTFTVSDLGEVKEIDPFEGITLDYEGASPSLNAVVNTDSANKIVKNYVTFTYSTYGFSIGDTVTVSIEDYDEQEFASNYGVIFTTLSKDFVCEDADYYTAEITGLTDEFLAEVKEASEAYLADGTNFNYSSSNTTVNVENTDITYLGYCYMYLNDFSKHSSSSGRTYNRLFLLYSAILNDEDEPVYYILGISDITENSASGEMSASLDSDSFRSYGALIYSGDGFAVNGYRDKERAIELIEDLQDKYYTISVEDLS